MSPSAQVIKPSAPGWVTVQGTVTEPTHLADPATYVVSPELGRAGSNPGTKSVTTTLFWVSSPVALTDRV